MTRIVFAAALMALACSGEPPREFADAPLGNGGEGMLGVGAARSSSVGAGGSMSEDGESGESGESNASGAAPAAGGTTGSGGSQAQAGAAGTPTAGGSGNVGGSGGASAGTGGNQMSSAGSGGQGGSSPTAGGGSGGSGEPIECSRDMLDCTDEPGCETWMLNDDHCGECGRKCGVTQVCKRTGPGGDYYCQTP